MTVVMSAAAAATSAPPPSPLVENHESGGSGGRSGTASARMKSGGGAGVDWTSHERAVAGAWSAACCADGAVHGVPHEPGSAGRVPGSTGSIAASRECPQLRHLSENSRLTHPQSGHFQSAIVVPSDCDDVATLPRSNRTQTPLFRARFGYSLKRSSFQGSALLL